MTTVNPAPLQRADVASITIHPILHPKQRPDPVLKSAYELSSEVLQNGFSAEHVEFVGEKLFGFSPKEIEQIRAWLASKLDVRYVIWNDSTSCLVASEQWGLNKEDLLQAYFAACVARLRSFRMLNAGEMEALFSLVKKVLL